MAAARGITEDRLRRARHACNVTTTRVGKGGPNGNGFWLWSLPGKHRGPDGPLLATLPPEQDHDQLEQGGGTTACPPVQECASWED